MRNRVTASGWLRLIFFFLLLSPFFASAQDGGFVVKKWRPDSLGPAAEKYLLVGIGSGYGFSTWNHKVNNVFQHQGSDALLFPNNPISESANGFINLAQTIEQQPFSGAGLGVSERRTVAYKGTGGTIPVNLDILYNIGKFRIGATVGWEFYRVNTLTYEDGTYQMRDLELSGKRSVLKYGLQAEYMILDQDIWRLGVQAKGGMFNLFGDIDKELSKEGRLMFGGGPIVEVPIGNAFMAYAAPTYEYRNYASSTLESGVEAENTLGTIYLNVGIRARLDNLFAKHPLCPIPSCHVRKVHMHSKGVYRGQPWFKKQNPRVGENLPREKEKNGKKKIKKPYVIKDPKKQLKKSQRRQEKNEKKAAKGKTLQTEDANKQVAPGVDTGIEQAAPSEDGKKKRKKKKRKGEEAPPPPPANPDDEE